MPVKKKLAPSQYLRITALGLRIHEKSGSYVKRSDLEKALRKKGWLHEFNAYFGVQGEHEFGPYAWDVESALERMATGKRPNSQLLWD